MATVVKHAHELTLKDRLSRLSYPQACRLLGPRGSELIARGGEYEVDIVEQVELSEHCFQLRLPWEPPHYEPIIVTLSLSRSRPRRIQWECTHCTVACEHVGAALALILEEKVALGLAAPPRETEPLERLSEEELIERALAERAERARTERMRVRSLNPEQPWTDYLVTSEVSGKTYRVALRGLERGQSYCSCPDFRTNTLGTCKHIMHVLLKVRRRFSRAALSVPYRRTRFSIALHYGEELTLRLLSPEKISPQAARIVQPFRNRPIEDVHELLRCVARLEALGEEVIVYPDAEQYIQQRLFQERIRALVEEIRRDPASHPLRRELLRVELLPYQLDGIAFAVGAGRAILADEMGLGKTIQAIGVAELLAREAGIRKVLVICPASLKAQWRNEIAKFCDRDCQVVYGPTEERAAQYGTAAFFTICNYEQVLRDYLAIERVHWDLIILDEGQRIKNWETKTSRVIKSLRSPFALVLSGTPLENRLDELYSVVEFIDDRRLAPAFRFFHRHRVVDDRGKVIGYKNLGELRENLKPILLRRTRRQVMSQLPPRTTEVVRVEPTEEQIELHRTYMQIVVSIVRKRYLTEMDLLRLRQALTACRMAADSTYLVDKQPPGYSSKLEALQSLLEQLFAEPDRKAVLFSEWTTMLGLIEGVLQGLGLSYVRLDGSVPQRQRQVLVQRFQQDPECKLFITTNAGSTGLNLQAANTVINVDLPWNPAVLEQRIARAHRLGQQQPVQVYLLVTEGTVEENLLGTLSAKQELFIAALDPETDLDQVDLVSGVEELKRRLEILLGARPAAAVDESVQAAREAEARQLARRERVAAAAGQLLTAALDFLGALVPETQPGNNGSSTEPALQQRLYRLLQDCLEETPEGQLRVTVTLPGRDALERFAGSLAKILSLQEASS